MNQTLRLTLVLGTTCLLASIVLAVGNLVTEKPCRQAAARERQRSLRLVLPEFRNDPTAAPDVRTYVARNRDGQEGGLVTFYQARDAAQGGRLVALAGEATSPLGYGGGVTVLAALDPEGTVMQVMVTAHSETPGLGTRVTDRVMTRYIWQIFSRSAALGLPPSRYLDQYSGRAAADLGARDFGVVKSAGEVTDRTVQAVSGATVSSKAVADAVSLICAAFNQHRAELSLP